MSNSTTRLIDVPAKVTERLQAIGLTSHNGDAAIQQLVSQAIA